MSKTEKKLIQEQNEIICEHCGGGFHYDQGRRCWSCDGLSCYGCVSDGPRPLCPECIDEMPANIEPMLAQLSELPKDQGRWSYEFKWDGMRALAYWDGKKLKLKSRNNIDVTGQYPELQDLGDYLPEAVVLDGEIVAPDQQGRPSFQLLQKRMHVLPSKAEQRSREVTIWYYVFDILYYREKSLLYMPYSQRRQLLESMVIGHRRCKIPPRYSIDGKAMVEVAKQYGLEGVIAKDIDSAYEAGIRSRRWKKIKIVKMQEFVIGGWTSERNNSARIGSLLIGVWENGFLKYCGSVGSGFSDLDHEMLVGKLQELGQQENPFSNKKFGKSEINFVKPRLVAEVEYRRWPKGGGVQQGAYKGLRSDKPVHEVGREVE